MPTFLRQLSGREGWSSTSKRLSQKAKYTTSNMHGMDNYLYDDGGNEDVEFVEKKRVMVVVDQSSSSKHAMMWALSHLTNKGDLLTLLQILPPLERSRDASDSCSPHLAKSLGTLCKASKPEVEVEALVIQGPRLGTVISQVKKLEVSVLVLGQKKSSASFLFNCLCGSMSGDFVEQCINNAECLTLGVRKQGRGMGGYLISSRWQKDFWLLA